MAKENLKAFDIRLPFLESLWTDPTVIERNIFEIKVRSLYYRNVDPEKALGYLTKRIEHYEVDSETVNDVERRSYTRIVTAGIQLDFNVVQSYAQAKIVSNLLNSHIVPESSYILKHDESKWKFAGQLRREPDFTDRGKACTRCLACLINSQLTDNRNNLPSLRSSHSRRTGQTVRQSLTMTLCCVP